MEQTNEAIVQPSGGARLKKGGKAPFLLLGALVVLLAAYLGLCAWAVRSPSVWRGAHVLGQDIGGLTEEEAARRVEAALPGLEIGLYLYDGALEAVPGQMPAAPDAVISLADLNAAIDVPALVRGAADAVRSGPFLTAGWRYFTSQDIYYGGGAGGEIQVDTTAAAQAARDAAAQLSWDARDTGFETGEDSLLIHLAKDGRAVSAPALQTQLERAYWDAELTLYVPYTVTAAQTLTAREIYEQVSGEVKNAGYDAATNTIIPERMGAEFDVTAAQAAMDGGAPGETVSIAAQIEYPRVTAKTLQSVLFRDVLGECRTHVGGTAARKSNVRLASSAFNNVVLNTGDVFSYNETVGQRTTAKGYQAAPAYVKGETVDEIGGGVCQPSSTLYLACLRANMEITERYAHRYVPAYIPWGMDATVSWGGPDYKFTNNTDYPVKIVTTYEGGYLTVRLLGTNEQGITSKMTNETLSTTPWETVYQEDATLPAGTEKVQTTPYTGYKVRTYRNLYDADGKLISSTYEATSDYKVRNKVILRGPAPVTEPETPVAGPVEIPAEPVSPVTPPTPGEAPDVAPEVPPEETPVIVIPENGGEPPAP